MPPARGSRGAGPGSGLCPPFPGSPPGNGFGLELGVKKFPPQEPLGGFLWNGNRGDSTGADGCREGQKMNIKTPKCGPECGSSCWSSEEPGGFSQKVPILWPFFLRFQEKSRGGGGLGAAGGHLTPARGLSRIQGHCCAKSSNLTPDQSPAFQREPGNTCWEEEGKALQAIWEPPVEKLHVPVGSWEIGITFHRQWESRGCQQELGSALELWTTPKSTFHP